jgi:hypothetical protein
MDGQLHDLRIADLLQQFVVHPVADNLGLDRMRGDMATRTLGNGVAAIIGSLLAVFTALVWWFTRG